MTAEIILDKLNTETVVGILALAGIVFGSVIGLKTKRQATEANRAVNHQRDGEPTILELVKQTNEGVKDIRRNITDLYKKVDVVENFMHRYDGSALSDGAAVERLVAKVDHCAENIEDLKRDVMTYGCPVRTGELTEPPAECQNPDNEQKP